MRRVQGEGFRVCVLKACVLLCCRNCAGSGFRVYGLSLGFTV